MKEYKTEYRIKHWADTTELQWLLNELVNRGWRVDHHKLDADGVSGWTIFSKTTVVMPDIMEARMPLRELWNILNSTASLYPEENGRNMVVETLSKKIHEYYDKNAKEMQ